MPEANTWAIRKHCRPEHGQVGPILAAQVLELCDAYEKLLADNETLSSARDAAENEIEEAWKIFPEDARERLQHKSIGDAFWWFSKRQREELCDLAAEMDALKSERAEALEFLNRSRYPDQPEYNAEDALSETIEHRLEVELLWHREIADQMEDLAEVVGWEDALDEVGFAPHVRQHIEGLRAESDQLRTKLERIDASESRLIDRRDWLEDQIGEIASALGLSEAECEWVTGLGCATGNCPIENSKERAALLLELLREIRPEIEKLRERCGYHFGTEPRCKDCQEYAHLDSWLDRTGHLMSDLVPTEGAES